MKVPLSAIKKLTPRQLTMWAYLGAEFGNLQFGRDGTGDRWFFVSWGEIADNLGWGRTTVRDTARELQQLGYLEKRARTRRSLQPCDSNLFRIRFGRSAPRG
jgi:hypothetical protein